ncbi:hypothetical protein JMJ77_0010003 [Colletotrichum scovillei]|uniref:Uncharacterized protein n=1 Tax=Colletotrichum scovillei TaxID=1209932 RepID=A0A9P7U7W5_9PEZI|nr:hypothetical protein JMJ78_0001075 [Colletotrichum scovillei]KAG7040899.1 hypothetical protein JMJ77_0010003 [Colletotrichum scovillei]KAG7060943.1 hypothetical protein JMJ76_0010016 [Colletotrichum scovillei]
MNHTQIPSRLGIFRLKEADTKSRLFSRLGKKYIFAVAEKYPLNLDDALFLVYFPLIPYGSSDAIIFIRSESDRGFRRYAAVVARGDPQFEIEIQHYPAESATNPQFLMIKETARFHSLADVISQRQDKKTIDTIKIGLKFRRSWVGSPEYTEWNEEAGTPVKYRTEDFKVWDDTNAQVVMLFHHFNRAKKPSGARFSIDLAQKSGDSNGYLIHQEHVLPVLAKATMHALLAWNYWTHDLQEASPIRRDEEEPS